MEVWSLEPSRIYDRLLRCVICTIDPKRLEHHILAFPMGQNSRARAREGREKEEEETKRIPPPFIRRVSLVSFSFKTGLGLRFMTQGRRTKKEKKRKREKEKKRKSRGGKGQGFGCFAFSPFPPSLVLSVNNRHARMREMDAQ